MPKRQLLKNLRFGKLIVIGDAPDYIDPKTGISIGQVRCACDCGTVRIVRRGQLTSGHTQSCGCQRRLTTTQHGHARRRERGGKTRTYESWKNLRRRCPKQVCRQWKCYATFLADVGEMPLTAYTLDLIDPTMGFTAGNVRWVSQKERNANIVRARQAALVGKHFGRLLIIGSAEPTLANNRYPITRVLCECQCGAVKVLPLHQLRSGKTQTCGCRIDQEARHGHARRGKMSPTYWTWRGMLARCDRKSQTHYKHYGGRGITVCQRWRVFENLLADLGERPSDKTLHRMNNDGHYSCGKCAECLGKRWPLNAQWATNTEQKDEVFQRLSSAAIARGSMQKIMDKPLAVTPRPTKTSNAYHVWQNMLRRCYTRSDPAYPRYGGRGITVSERWRQSFKNFISDMGPRPLRWTLERKDNERGYCKDNCIWATYQEQAQNKRNVQVHTVRGITGSLKFICDHFGVPYPRVLYRVRSGRWKLEDAIFTPHIFMK